MMNFITEYKEFDSRRSWMKVRNFLGSTLIFFKSLPLRIDGKTEWIRFPFYHHVFDDERSGFSRQLDYLKNFGDFISIDEAVYLLSSKAKINGRYFCITFDDGFKNCVTNALPILMEKQVRAAFFIPTKYIGISGNKSSESNHLSYGNAQLPHVEFLNWDDCRTMAAAGMTLGSHTVSHSRLITLDSQGSMQEMRDSKAKIEQEIVMPCLHFSCPHGRPGMDFIEERDPLLARKIGYGSFLTTLRGPMHQGDSPYRVRRDRVLANWGAYKLRYYFSL